MSRDYCNLHGMYYGMVCPSCYNKQLEHGINKLREGWGEHVGTPKEIFHFVLETLEHIRHDMDGDTQTMAKVKVEMSIELINNYMKRVSK